MVDDEVAADAEIVLIVQDFPSPEAKAALAKSTDTILSPDKLPA